MTQPDRSEGQPSMNEIARRWRLLAGGAAAGVAAVVGFAGTTASPQRLGQRAVAPATAAAAAAAPGGISIPAVPTPPPVTITPAASGTMADFFKSKNVALEPQNSRDFKALNIVLPMPKGWAQ